MDSSKPVTQIGKYEVLSELGRGGMGVVYRAEDTVIGREVAIKQLLDATPDLRMRFYKEAKSTGILNHPNIVTVYESGDLNGDPYIVMEFLSGESLERIMKSGRVMPLVEKLEIIRQVCEGLGYAHEKGVVHRDIKPANIMVQPNGHIKIVDFGIAQLENSSGHTATGAVIGTFHYIAPERLKGQPSDGRADIWACGIMLYQMLTNRLPFAGEDVSALHKVVNEAFEPLSSFISNYPPSLDAIMDRALAKDPNQRYSTAEEMAADLEAINETLKRSRVGEVLIQVKGLLEQEQLSTARPMLMDLQRLDPQNTEVRRLLRDVQDKLSKQQKSDQIRQMLQQAEHAVRDTKFNEAIEIYKQADRLDPTHHGLTGRIAQVRALKETADKVESLKSQARDARHNNDFTRASMLIGEAIKLDTGNTDLRNEQARIMQEQDRLAKDGERRRLKNAGRESLSGRQFTQAVKVLREAFELDPTDSEAQTMLQEAVARQEEDRRRKIIDQIVAEIQDHIFRGQLERALELTDRALERLPGEAVLLRLRAETEKKHAAATTQKLVEDTSMQVQALFLTQPQEALAIVQRALDSSPTEERLLALQQRVVDQLKRSNLEGLRSQYMKQAQTAVAAKDYDQAIHILENALLDCGDTPEIQSLLQYVRQEKKTTEQRAASASVIRDAQQLIGAGELEEAIALLKRGFEGIGDPAIEQLLRQTQERYDEVGRRVEAVLSRIQALSESDPPQALQLLQSQPQAIQQHPQMRSLRARLDARSEQERATREAVKRASEQLQQGQLREGLETLEAVRQAFGDFPQVASAIADYKARRTPLANATLTSAMAQARQSVLAQEAPKALEVLRKSTPSVEFADLALQTDWKRLAEEVTKAAGIKRGSTENLPIIVQGSKLSPRVIFSIAAAVILLVVGTIVFVVKNKPAPVGSTDYLQLNASPYAEVLSVTPESGAAVTLPPGDHPTPMRLDGLVDGSYKVTFRGADGASATADCKVSPADHLCSAPEPALTDNDIETIVKGGQ